MDTNTPHQPITKSWVHEPERLASARAAKFARLARISEVPAIFSGIVMVVVGRRIGGVVGRVLVATGATLSLTAGGRVFNRIALSRLRAPDDEPSMA